MGHMIEEHDKGALTDHAWHHHPLYVVHHRTLTVDDLHAVFDWEVESWPVYAQNPATGEFALCEGKRANVRNDIGLPLSVMSGTYTPNQYRDRFVQIAEVAIDNGFSLETAGTLGNGKKAFVSFRLPDGMEFTFGEREVNRPWLNFGDALDGTSTLRGSSAVQRMVCANTFQAYLLDVPPLFSIKHTANATKLVDQVLATLDGSIKSAIGVRDAIDRLLDESYYEYQFMQMLPDLLGDRPDEEGRARTMYDNKFDGIVGRYRRDDLDDIRETKFGALMAVQAFEQHVQTVRGASRDLRHMDNVLFGDLALSARAAQLVGV